MRERRAERYKRFAAVLGGAIVAAGMGVGAFAHDGAHGESTEGKKADDMMYLLTNPAVLAPYAAQTIKVEGTAYADKHSIDVQKLYVKDGSNWKEVQLKDEHHGAAAGAHDHDHGAASHDHK